MDYLEKQTLEYAEIFKLNGLQVISIDDIELHDVKKHYTVYDEYYYCILNASLSISSVTGEINGVLKVNK